MSGWILLKLFGGVFFPKVCIFKNLLFLHLLLIDCIFTVVVNYCYQILHVRSLTFRSISVLHCSFIDISHFCMKIIEEVQIVHINALHKEMSQGNEERMVTPSMLLVLQYSGVSQPQTPSAMWCKQMLVFQEHLLWSFS